MPNPFKPFRPRLKSTPSRSPQIQPPENTESPLRVGDRIAFITLGANPRTLCAIVTEPSVKDARGRIMHKVQAAGRSYLARPNALYKLPGHKLPGRKNPR